jgi:DNA polymerase
MSDPGSTAAALIPARPTPERLRAAAADCRACELWREGTQTVFGEGPSRARIVAVGEQPGDREDRDGRPFVGPAGRLFDTTLERAGIDRADVYVTNAVKHFKFTLPERGKRRIHKTPSRTEVVACRPWLFAEMMSVEPDVVVLLGATAAKSLMGNDFRLTAHRGEALHLPATDELADVDFDPQVAVTVHPSSVLRGPPEDRAKAFDGLVSDLRFAAALVTH